VLSAPSFIGPQKAKGPSPFRMMALCVLNLWELHHPAARVLPRSSPRLSRRTPSTSARIDTTDRSGVTAATPELPGILNKFMKPDYGRASSACQGSVPWSISRGGRLSVEIDGRRERSVGADVCRQVADVCSGTDGIRDLRRPALVAILDGQRGIIRRTVRSAAACGRTPGGRSFNTFQSSDWA
jgi:hypothetical protein